MSGLRSVSVGGVDGGLDAPGRGVQSVPTGGERSSRINRGPDGVTLLLSAAVQSMVKVGPAAIAVNAAE